MDELFDLIEPSIKDWLISHHFFLIATYLRIILVLLFSTPVLLVSYRGISKIFKFFKIKNSTKNLLPFINDYEVKEAIRHYVPTRGQNISPSNELEPSDSQIFVSSSELMPIFLNRAFKKKQPHRLFLILADSGMGKSTFLINLFIKYKSKYLKSRFGMYLIPMGHPQAKEEINSIDKKDQEESILLLDAFDEDTKVGHNYKERLDELLKLTWRFKAVVLTCRTQFFPTEADEPMSTGLFMFSLDDKNYQSFKKIYLSPFNDKDIKLYLNKRYPYWKFWQLETKRKAKELVLLCPYLMVRPMLLSYIDVLIATKTSRIKEPPKTTSDVYARLIEHWIAREANRIHPERRENFKTNMKQFSENLAVNFFVNRKKRGGLYIDSSEIVLFAKEYNIELSELELKGKSLLNRNADGKYKFAHKSILEFLIAKYASENDAFAQGVYYFQELDGFDQAKNIYSELQVSVSTVIVGFLYDFNKNIYTILRFYDEVLKVEKYRIIDKFHEGLTEWYNDPKDARLELEKRVGNLINFQLLPNESINVIYDHGTKYLILYSFDDATNLPLYIAVTSYRLSITRQYTSEEEVIMELAIENPLNWSSVLEKREEIKYAVATEKGDHFQIVESKHLTMSLFRAVNYKKNFKTMWYRSLDTLRGALEYRVGKLVNVQDSSKWGKPEVNLKD